MKQDTQQAGWPPAVEVQAFELQQGDVLAAGGRITSPVSRHPSGWVVAEVDYSTLVRWEAGRTVQVYRKRGPEDPTEAMRHALFTYGDGPFVTRGGSRQDREVARQVLALMEQAGFRVEQAEGSEG